MLKKQYNENMVKKLLLSTMVALLITLSGWSQSSKNWTLQKDSVDKDVITYNFYKKDLTNLRVYVTTLEQFKKLYDIDEQQLLKQRTEIGKYKITINNDSIANAAQEKALASSLKLNTDLQKDVDKYKKKAGR